MGSEETATILVWLVITLLLIAIGFFILYGGFMDYDKPFKT